ncbi:glycosyl hydrolase 53 family protein [Streptomyces sp. NPDC047434]|uniref:glycoside hydrolase family 53 protein n=1 Tax=Streptomyces sp. NPDC047434 TaxID=3155143 RepID=UPI0033FBE325
MVTAQPWRVTHAGAPSTPLPASGALPLAPSPSGAGSPGAAAPADRSGWSVTGDRDASLVEQGGRDGGDGLRLTHWSPSAYRVETSRHLSGLPDGPYTLTAWARSGGGQRAVHLVLRDHAGVEQRTDLPPTPAGEWIRVVVSAEMTGGRCTVGLRSDAGAGQWAHLSDIALTPGATGLAVKGGDLSSLPRNEERGAVHRYADGTRGDALAVLGDAGMNLVRLKVWVNPADGYDGTARVLAMARRAAVLGLGILVDFHYSDTWADPRNQVKPAAWAACSYRRLLKEVHAHTYGVLRALTAQGTPPCIVQIGNEIDAGLLWEDGSTSCWDGLAGLLTAGARAVEAASPGTRVALHLACGTDNAATRRWFDQAVAHRVPFDVVALSYYGYWQDGLAALQTNLDDVAARYGRPVLVVETGYPHAPGDGRFLGHPVATPAEPVAGYPATPAGQAAHLRDVMSVVEAVPGGRGLGVVYWEPAWTALASSTDPAGPASLDGWEHQALFGPEGRLLEAARCFRHR